ncbi:hypothetical protein V1477_015732, partial [Vespula maculifrons]
FLIEKRLYLKLLTTNFCIFFGHYQGIEKYTTSIKFYAKLFKYQVDEIRLYWDVRCLTSCTSAADLAFVKRNNAFYHAFVNAKKIYLLAYYKRINLDSSLISY